MMAWDSLKSDLNEWGSRELETASVIEFISHVRSYVYYAKF